jgi:hypothetical protein
MQNFMTYFTIQPARKSFFHEIIFLGEVRYPEGCRWTRKFLRYSGEKTIAVCLCVFMEPFISSARAAHR